MARELLREKIKRRDVNLSKAKEDLIDFLNRKYILIRLDEYFNDFPLASNFLNATELIEYIKNLTSDTKCYESYGYPKSYISDELQVESYLTLVEAFYIVVRFLDKLEFIHLDDKGIKTYLRVIEINLNKLGYEIYETDSYLEPKICLIDNLAEQVASSSELKIIKWRIIDFNYYKTTLKEKEKILEDIYKVFEAKRNKFSNNLENTIADIMNNCVRHSMKKTPYKFFEDKREYWIDKTFDLFLNGFIEIECKDIMNEFKQLKEKEIQTE